MSNLRRSMKGYGLSNKGIVIAISGMHGSGKSTYAKILAKEFGLRHVSAGDIFRKIAIERNLSPEELSKVACNDRSIDLSIDEEIKHEAEKGFVILDGHLTGWIAKDLADLKIFLFAPDEVRIERIARREGKSIEEARKTILEIERMEIERWKRLYGIDLKDTSIYDIILNTQALPLQTGVALLKEAIKYVIKGKEERLKASGST